MQHDQLVDTAMMAVSAPSIAARSAAMAAGAVRIVPRISLERPTYSVRDASGTIAQGPIAADTARALWQKGRCDVRTAAAVARPRTDHDLLAEFTRPARRVFPIESSCQNPNVGLDTLPALRTWYGASPSGHYPAVLAVLVRYAGTGPAAEVLGLLRNGMDSPVMAPVASRKDPPPAELLDRVVVYRARPASCRTSSRSWLRAPCRSAGATTSSWT